MAPSAITITENYAPLLFNSEQSVKSKNCHYDGAENAKTLVHIALNEHIQNVNTDTCKAGEEDAFFVADMGDIYRQHSRWKTNLKRVKPHYAVKCNPDPEVLRLLAALGTGFDCASKAEIDQVLKMNVDPSRIIYAQPCKTKSYIRHAAKEGVKQMTFDNADELHKVKAFFPDAELYLRILTDDSSSLCRLSLKFGASIDDTQALLEQAKALNLNVVGVSFHVGSGASDPDCFRKAVADSRTVFNQALSLGYNLHTLDVGGGFTGDLFEEMAAVLSEALDQNFPPSVRVIGEPGRYFVSAAYTLACNIIARRDLRDPATGETNYMLYLNDGVYGNFSSIIFDHQHPVPRILAAENRPCEESHCERGPGRAGNAVKDGKSRTITYSLWGPTCDGIDRITESSIFTTLLDVGDWLYFEDMGAYTKCSATRFNGFTDSHEVIYVSSEAGASAILGY